MLNVRKSSATIFVAIMVIVVAALVAMVIYLMVEVQKLLHPSKLTTQKSIRSAGASLAAVSSSRKNLKSIQGAIIIPAGTSYQIQVINQFDYASLNAIYNQKTITIIMNLQGNQVTSTLEQYNNFSTTNVIIPAGGLLLQSVTPLAVTLNISGSGDTVPGVYIPTIVQNGYMQGQLVPTGTYNLPSFWPQNASNFLITTDGFFGTVQRSVLLSAAGYLNPVNDILAACFPSETLYNFQSPVFNQFLLSQNLGTSQVLPRTPPVPGSSYTPIGFVLDGTGVFINSINLNVGLANYAVVQSIPVGEAALFFILLAGSDWNPLAIQNALKRFSFYVTPSMSQAANEIAVQIPLFPQSLTTVTIDASGSFKIPLSNCMYIPGGISPGTGSDISSTNKAFIPRPLLNPKPPGPNLRGKLAIPALSVSNASGMAVPVPALLTLDGVGGSVPFKFTGMNRPGFEWSPMGWFHINQFSSSAPTFDPFVKQMQTITGSGQYGWHGQAVRLTLNQQFYLSNTAFTYSAGAYNYPGSPSGYYQNMVKQAVYAARSGGASIIILDLHWSDCGAVNPLHVQSGNGLCGNFNGNKNGVYGNVGQQMLPDANSLQFWTAICADYPYSDFPDVVFELYNEPFPWQNPIDSTNQLTYTTPANISKIWNAWYGNWTTKTPPGTVNPVIIPTPTLMNSSSPAPSADISCNFGFNPQMTVQAQYVGMQDVYNIIANSPNQNGRVCIVGGPQFSYRLDGILGSYSPNAAAAEFTIPFQFAIKDPSTGQPAANILYNAHPYTSQLTKLPTSSSTEALDLTEFTDAFGMITNFADFVCTEYGNNQGALVGNSSGTCDSDWQRQIVEYLDGKPSGGSQLPVPTRIPSYTSWAWYAGDCTFPSMIGLSENMNVYNISEYDTCAYEYGQPCTNSEDTTTLLGPTCMGASTLASMKWRAAGAALAAYSSPSPGCSQAGCPTVGSGKCPAPTPAAAYARSRQLAATGGAWF